MENKLNRVLVIAVMLLLLAVAGCGEDDAVEAEPADTDTADDSQVYEFNTTTNETSMINETNAEDAEDDVGNETLNETSDEIIEGNETEADEESKTNKEDEATEEPDAADAGMHESINITSQETFYGTIQNITGRDNTSVFVITDIKISTAAEDAGYRANVAKDDEISFKVTNRDDKDYYITYMKPEGSDILHAFKITVNGRRIKDIYSKCGSKFIKSGETLSCDNIPAVIKVGLNEMHDWQPYINTLRVESNYMESELMFRFIEEEQEEYTE